MFLVCAPLHTLAGIFSARGHSAVPCRLARRWAGARAGRRLDPWWSSPGGGCSACCGCWFCSAQLRHPPPGGPGDQARRFKTKPACCPMRRQMQRHWSCSPQVHRGCMPRFWPWKTGMTSRFFDSCFASLPYSPIDLNVPDGPKSSGAFAETPLKVLPVDLKPHSTGEEDGGPCTQSPCVHRFNALQRQGFIRTTEVLKTSGWSDLYWPSTAGRIKTPPAIRSGFQ